MSYKEHLTKMEIYVDAKDLKCIRCNKITNTEDGVMMPFNPGEYEFYCWNCVEEIYEELEGAME